MCDSMRERFDSLRCHAHSPGWVYPIGTPVRNSLIYVRRASPGGGGDAGVALDGRRVPEQRLLCVRAAFLLTPCTQTRRTD